MSPQMVDIENPNFPALTSANSLDRSDLLPNHLFTLSLRFDRQLLDGRTVEDRKGLAGLVDGDIVFGQDGMESRAEEGGGDVAALVAAFVGA